jgi:hypothetical protein
MSVVTFSSEAAQKALDAAKDMSKKENRILVKSFLAAMVSFLPTEESYKNRKKDEGTDKQKNRKRLLVKKGRK